MIDNYAWFTSEQLTQMIAISGITPGPIGLNMATFAGFQTAGISGGITATVGLVLPSLVIVILISKVLRKYMNSPLISEIMLAIRPVVIALIMFAGFELLTLSVTDWSRGCFALLLFIMVWFYKKSPIFYILLSGVLGVVLKL